MYLISIPSNREERHNSLEKALLQNRKIDLEEKIRPPRLWRFNTQILKNRYMIC